MSEPELIGSILRRIFRGKRDQLAAEIRGKFDPELSARLDHLQIIIDSLNGRLSDLIEGEPIPSPLPVSPDGGANERKDSEPF